MTESVRVLAGGCFCGQVRYAAAGAPFHETLCHCADCRRAAGAPAVARFSVERGQFRFTAGTPAAHHSSTKVVRRFCRRCGTQLTFEHDELPGELDITTASLDAPDAAPPRDHTWVASRLAWDHIGDDLPRFAQGRSAK